MNGRRCSRQVLINPYPQPAICNLLLYLGRPLTDSDTASRCNPDARRTYWHQQQAIADLVHGTLRHASYSDATS
jgi:hypothetical protein